MVLHKSLSWWCVSSRHYVCSGFGCVFVGFCNSKSSDSNFDYFLVVGSSYFLALYWNSWYSWKYRDQLRTPGDLLSADFFIFSYPDKHSASEVQTCLTFNCCLLSVSLLEHNIKWSLLPVGFLCSRWARPGRGQRAGGCREGTVLPHYWYHTCWHAYTYTDRLGRWKSSHLHGSHSPICADHVWSASLHH